jgi:uroporphyrin-3 C-methyltransferase
MNDLEKQEQQQSASEQTEPSADADSSQESPRPSQKIAIAALILALAGLVMGYVKWGELNASLQQEIKTLAAIKQQQRDAQGRMEESNRAISEQKTAFAKQSDRIKMQAEEMEQSLELVYERVGGSGTQWLVAEAEYLMRIANHRLQLEGDSKTASVALERADKRLHDSADPVWTPIREKLATEIAALKGLKELDLAGQAAKLSGLISQAQKLKLPHATLVERGKQEQAPQKEKEFNLDSVMHDFWVGFKSILKIRRHDQPVSAMLEPDQSFFLYQNLILQLEGARVALLRRDQTLFDTSLIRAETWTKEFFDQKDSITESMLQAISELKQLELAAEMPDISGSLRMLMVQQGRGDEISEPVAEQQQLPEEEKQMGEDLAKPALEEPVTADQKLESATDESKEEVKQQEQSEEEQKPSSEKQQAPSTEEQKEGT